MGVASGGFCETWTVVLRFFLVLNFLIMNTVVIANSDRVANAFFLFLLENNRHMHSMISFRLLLLTRVLVGRMELIW